MKILLLVENNDLINYLENIIIGHNDACVVLSDVSKNIPAIEIFNPDWILIDLSLKNTNGFELAEAIKNKVKHQKICILSDSLDERLSSKAEQIGADEFLPKENLYEFYKIINGVTT